MQGTHPGRQLFLKLVRKPDDQIDLVRTALAIGWEDSGSLDIDVALRTLEDIVTRAREHIVPDEPVGDQAERLVEYLYNIEGFLGDPMTFEEPANSYLHVVLEQRVGLPIILSLILMHVGRELGLPLEASALPGHFMVRCPDQNGVLFLDLFNGRVLDNAQCRRFLQRQLGYEVPDPERLPPPSRRQIIARLLRNLKRSYVRREDNERALAATERILTVDPGSAEDVRDRGLLRARIGDLHWALYDLEEYMVLEPMAQDQTTIQKYAQTIVEVFGNRN